MKQIQDQSLFLQEFQKLIDSKSFTNMKIDEDTNGIIIRLEEHLKTNKQAKREHLLKTLEETAGLLNDYPDSIKREFQAIADRSDCHHIRRDFSK